MAAREQRPFFPGGGGLGRQEQLTNEDITNQGRVLLTQFIHDRMVDDGFTNTPAMEQLQEPDTPAGKPMEHILEIGRALKCIGDDLDKDQHLQELVSRVQPDQERNVLLRVASNIFEDNIFSWGRVVALFVFAYKICSKALNRIPLMRAIINLIVDFMRDHVVEWVKNRGGWEGIREYFGATNGQLTFVAVTGAAIFAGIYAYKNWA